jgi:hypothetical protein
MTGYKEPTHTNGKHGVASSSWNKLTGKRYVVSTIVTPRGPETAVFQTLFGTSFSLPWKIFKLYQAPGIPEEFQMINHMFVVQMVEECPRKDWSLEWIKDVVAQAERNLPEESR